MAALSSNNIGLIVMGPCACGKSEVGSALAKHYNCTFLDGDGYHPEENIAKMQNGIPLTDNDRLPWLQRVRKEMIDHSQNTLSATSATDSLGPKPTNNVAVIAACSALKKSYRIILTGDGSCKKLKTVFVFLKCSREVLEQRLENRTEHFMKLGMLESQLKTLEFPDESEAPYFVIVNGDLELDLLLLEAQEKIERLIAKGIKV